MMYEEEQTVDGKKISKRLETAVHTSPGKNFLFLWRSYFLITPHIFSNPVYSFDNFHKRKSWFKHYQTQLDD